MLLQYRVIDNKKEELLDIVDQNDNVVGVETRENYKDEIFKSQQKYARTVNCFLINKDHQIWTPTRSPNKRSFPNALDFSCGGFVQSGETYKDAIISEIKEEANIIADPLKLELLGKLTPITDFLNVFVEVYKYYVEDTQIDYNKNDFTNAEWLSVSELLERLRNGFPAKSSLLPALIKFQDLI